MMKRVIYASAAILTLLVAFGFQSGKDVPPGGIKLMPGYEYTAPPTDVRGVNLPGNIRKENGIEIYYYRPSICDDLPVSDKRYVWYKEQLINKQHVRIILSRENLLLVCFPKHATFMARVHSDEDIADVLLMVLTYKVK